MKIITITCDSCGNEAEKPLKEINRRKRLGKTKFYCSISCAGKDSWEHLLPWAQSEQNKENCRNLDNTDEYTGFREFMRTIRVRINEGKKYTDTNIDLQYLKELWESQNGRCVYTNVELIQPGFINRTGINKNYQASLDRIDNSVGYYKGNVQFVSVTCNWLKNSLDDVHVQEFFEIVQNINPIDK